MNKSYRQHTGKLAILIIAAALALSACGNSNSSGEASGTSPSPATANAAATAPAETSNDATTRLFKDWTGHEVEIPVNPKRVVFYADTTGDILALGITPIGILKDNVKASVFEDKVVSAEDLGLPISVEKTITLEPDLIVFGNSDEAVYEQLSKVAPTVSYDSFASLTDRLTTLGDMLGKKDEAAAWLAKSSEREAAMWKEIHAGGVGENETATVVTFYPGNRLFVMMSAGLPQLLYSEGGFKKTAIIESTMKQEVGFVEVSLEKLPEYAGDRIFVLTPVSEDAQQSTSDLKNSPVWKSLPAVSNGYVYEIPIMKSLSDAVSREWLLEELPKLLAKP
ncbi:ABC transporter substrate-binding protein [Paenibacillus sp. NPDC058071]|uniref:ABC transporter substrate-binding protein n=1 Tax=Paenibacillus sp. NPDC058071 TaxID=3346326 RepID=UPI0036DA874E